MQMPSHGSVLTPESPLLKLDPIAFKNVVDKNAWVKAAFSSDVEYVSAAAAHKACHIIYIWNRLGQLERTLEGTRTTPSSGNPSPLLSDSRSASCLTNGHWRLWASAIFCIVHMYAVIVLYSLVWRTHSQAPHQEAS